MALPSTTCPFCPPPTTTRILMTATDYTLTLMKCEHCAREWTSFSDQTLEQQPTVMMRPEQFVSMKMSSSR